MTQPDLKLKIPVVAAVWVAALLCNSSYGQSPSETLRIWPQVAPLETAQGGTGNRRVRAGKPAITLLTAIDAPTMDVYLAEHPNGTGVLVLPGGGFRMVVPDLEGSETVPFLNKLGISVFVLKYRTSERRGQDEPLWKRPAQDAQRALRILRQRADEWKLKPNQIGMLAFSAGGQVGSVVHTATAAHYDAIDDTDKHSCTPDFSLLVYPWRILDAKSGQLMAEIKVTQDNAPAFIVHTHDDQSTSVGAALLYIEFKRAGVPAELHVYQNGGHGYGVRPQENSVIHTWADRARDWLIVRKLGRAPRSGQ